MKYQALINSLKWALIISLALLVMTNISEIDSLELSNVRNLLTISTPLVFLQLGLSLNIQIIAAFILNSVFYFVLIYLASSAEYKHWYQNWRILLSLALFVLMITSNYVVFISFPWG